MANILDVLFLKHTTWIKYVKSFGCPNDIAEDFVQEMYIKIYDYSQKKNNDLMYNLNEVNYFFIYVTLKNLYYDTHRQSKKQTYVDFDDNIEILEEEYSEEAFNLQKKAIDIWIVRLNDKIAELDKEEYSKKSVSLNYYKYIFEKVFVQQTSVSDLSREIGITYWSLRNTLNNIKRQINEET
jgi:DNA-directed RNA polymerase specialized sigma24 family protein